MKFSFQGHKIIEFLKALKRRKIYTASRLCLGKPLSWCNFTSNLKYKGTFFYYQLKKGIMLILYIMCHLKLVEKENDMRKKLFFLLFWKYVKISVSQGGTQKSINLLSLWKRSTWGSSSGNSSRILLPVKNGIDMYNLVGQPACIANNNN